MVDLPPETFDNDIVQPSTSAVHAHPDASCLHAFSPLLGSEVAALIGIDDLKLAIMRIARRRHFRQKPTSKVLDSSQAMLLRECQSKKLWQKEKWGLAASGCRLYPPPTPSWASLSPILFSKYGKIPDGPPGTVVRLRG
jgi:hypothetical protein